MGEPSGATRNRNSRSRGGRGDARGFDRISRRRLWAEIAARWVAGAGAVAVIGGILGILVFLAVEVLPLFAAARLEPARSVALTGAPPEALLVGPQRTWAAVLGLDGVLRVWRLDEGSLVAKRPLRPVREGLHAARVNAFDSQLLAATRDGHVLLAPVDFASGGGVAPELGEAEVLQLDPTGSPVGAFVGRSSEESTTVVAQLADGRLVLERLRQAEATSEEPGGAERRRELASPGAVLELLLDREQRDLYAIGSDGRLLWWRLSDGDSARPTLLSHGTSPVTAAALLVGNRSLVAGRADGTLDVWSQVLDSDGTVAPAYIRSFPGQGAPIRRITASPRDRSFLAQDAAGGLGLYHSTSGRTLWRGESPVTASALALFAPGADAVLFADGQWLVELAVANPHPGASLSTLFRKNRYEGDRTATWTWQSGGGPEIEPKLSLIPLLFGTLKATVYALAVAIPLAVLAAIYTAQYMHRRLQRVVKPTVEMMASLPSVVLGFVAGLWLAPRLEEIYPALLAMLLAVPVAPILAGACWRRLPPRPRARLPEATEIVWHGTFLVLVIAGCLQLNGPVEAWLFGGDFPAWLRETTGLSFQQRNAIVVGIAMGFAVIPIIFSISEDALSRVPRELVGGSLALGADRWQTLVRVVLPPAIPGILSAIMLGFGRAVGETMVVLMATANTPIMEWSPFSDFRTLSANIALEMPEAAPGSTLYRTLLVAAILLFAVTFAINTVAELVRQRLRTRYARL